MQIADCLARFCIPRNSIKKAAAGSNKYSETYSGLFAEYGDPVRNREGPMVARAFTA